MEGLISLIASYYVFYVSYPKSSPVTGVLLFVQEVLLGQPDVSVKKTSKYAALINSQLKKQLYIPVVLCHMHCHGVSKYFSLILNPHTKLVHVPNSTHYNSSICVVCQNWRH